MKSSHRKTGVLVISGVGAAFGGYYLGKAIDSRRQAPGNSAFTYATALLPALGGVLAWYFLRKKKPTVAKGILWGGIAGSALGYYKVSNALSQGPGAMGNLLAAGPLSILPGGGAPTAPGSVNLTAGTGMTAAAANTGNATMAPAMNGPGARRRARNVGASLVLAPAAPGVRRALNNPFGAGIGDMILPNRFQTGSPAFGRDAWGRR